MVRHELPAHARRRLVQGLLRLPSRRCRRRQTEERPTEERPIAAHGKGRAREGGGKGAGRGAASKASPPKEPPKRTSTKPREGTPSRPFAPWAEKAAMEKAAAKEAAAKGESKGSSKKAKAAP